MKKLTREEFIAQAIATHGNKYDYSRVEYNGRRQKVCIICPQHGEFYQRAGSHILGQGCPKCYNERRWANRLLTVEEFINRSNKIHNSKYDYSKVCYVGSTQHVEIICPVHGSFWQAPARHLAGQGCAKCYADATRQRKTKTQSDFIRDARKTHGDIYDYSKAVYLSGSNKVCIICPNGHEFWQNPHQHISGQGCPVCLESNGEQAIREALTNAGIAFESQKRFHKWMGRQSLDFYLPDFKIGIEHQGKQHFTPVKQWGNFKWIHEKDLTKQSLCVKHGITILYLTTPDVYRYPKENWEWMQPNLFTDINALIDTIK